MRLTLTFNLGFRTLPMITYCFASRLIAKMWQFFSLWYCIFTMLKYQHWYAGNAAYICWISSMYMLKFQHRVAIPNPLQPPHLLNFEVSILQYQNENSIRKGLLLFLSAEFEPLKIVKLELRKSEKGYICNLLFSYHFEICYFQIKYFF